jgi:TadE-like protein
MRRLRRAQRTADEGSATLEVAILAPVLLLVIFTVVQVAVFAYARSLALGAAQEGVAAGRVDGGTSQAARASARGFLDHTAGDSLQSSTVRVLATATEVEVEVRGRAISLLPGFPGLPVRQSARGPIERFTSP